MEEIITHSSLETEKLALDFSKKLKPGDVIFLVGDLGSGKTTFVKGLAKGFGIEERVISPTFVVVRQHDVPSGEIKTLYHMDLYRLTDEFDAKAINLTDFLEDPTAVTVIEWPAVSENIVNRPSWIINFTANDPDTRTITISHG